MKINLIQEINHASINFTQVLRLSTVIIAYYIIMDAEGEAHIPLTVVLFILMQYA